MIPYIVQTPYNILPNSIDYQYCLNLWNIFYFQFQKLFHNSQETIHHTPRSSKMNLYRGEPVYYILQYNKEIFHETRHHHKL